MQDDLRLNMFSDIGLKSKHNTIDTFETFDRFFFAFGWFSAINELTVVPTGDVPSFVQLSNSSHLLNCINEIIQEIPED